MQTEYEQSADEKIKFLENELHKRETEIALLKETSDDVASELHFDRVLSIVAERAQKLIGSETLLIPILDAARSQYTYRAGCGMNAAEIFHKIEPAVSQQPFGILPITIPKCDVRC